MCRLRARGGDRILRALRADRTRSHQGVLTLATVSCPAELVELFGRAFVNEGQPTRFTNDGEFGARRERNRSTHWQARIEHACDGGPLVDPLGEDEGARSLDGLVDAAARVADQLLSSARTRSDRSHRLR